jgi:hypothetical protein
MLEREVGLLEEGWLAHDLAKLTQSKAEGGRAVDIAPQRRGQRGCAARGQGVSGRCRQTTGTRDEQPRPAGGDTGLAESLPSPISSKRADGHAS